MMTRVTLAEMEDHRRWLHRFRWCYMNGGDRTEIDALLAQGVRPLCEQDRVFLHNMEHAYDAKGRKLVPARGGRSQGLEVFTETIIDNEVARLRSDGLSYPQIARRMGPKWVRRFTANDLRQRIHRLRTKPRKDPIAAFAALYQVYSVRYF